MDIESRIGEIKTELELMVDGIKDFGLSNFIYKMAFVAIAYAMDGKSLDFRSDMFAQFEKMYYAQNDSCTIIVRDGHNTTVKRGTKLNLIVRNEALINESIEINVDNNVIETFRATVSGDGRIYCKNHKGRTAKVIILGE